jgi:hypothetical protein
MAQDYTWLQAKVTRWIRRSDLAADIPDFIQLAEKRITADLNARLQNTIATLPTTANVSTVSLPSDFNAMRSLTLPTYGDVVYLTPEKFDSSYPDQTAGVPRNYTLIGSSIVLGPVPDDAYSLRCVYRAEIPALATAPSGINWLLTDHPEIYLAATLSEAFAAIRDDENQQRWDAKYQDAVDSLNKNDWNSAGTLTVRTDTRTP